ncbi:hypothetical protein [Mycolicibacterium canariasense]|uniref:hypothetical protein n=1 Tax=Mycolicibacterium canariasense TaxID=228230 RepID=UPI0032D5A705
MSTAADKIKANAERLRQKPSTGEPSPAPADDPASSTPAPTASIVRQKNVRRTVDLSPTAHRGLDNWQRNAADKLGLARVTGQEVLAALVNELLSDSDLSDRITAALSNSRS